MTKATQLPHTYLGAMSNRTLIAAIFKRFGVVMRDKNTDLSRSWGAVKHVVVHSSVGSAIQMHSSAFPDDVATNGRAG